MKLAAAKGMNDMFEEEYKKFLKRLSEKHKNIKLPEKVGPGFLSNLATEKNLCTATWEENGNAIVCATPLWKDEFKSPSPYLCLGHYKERMDYINSLPKYAGPKPKNTESLEKLKGLLTRIKEKIDKQSGISF